MARTGHGDSNSRKIVEGGSEVMFGLLLPITSAYALLGRRDAYIRWTLPSGRERQGWRARRIAMEST